MASRTDRSANQRTPAALGVLGLSLVLAACSSTDPAPEPIRPAIVARPTPAAASDPAAFSGEVRARHESQLGFRVGGKIERRLVDAGAQVAIGDVLAVLDPTDLRLNMAASAAAMASAQADAALAQSEYERAAALLERQLISTSQFQAQQTARSSAQARLAQAQAQDAVSRNQVAYAQLTADRAGIVTTIHAEAGQVVAPGQVVAVLAQDGEPEVEIALPESQVSQYPVGTPARVSIWSAPERGFDGIVREVSPDADSLSRTFRARVALVDPDPAVQLGMTASVRFPVASDAALLAIPLTALHAVEGTPAVWVVDPATAQVSLRAVGITVYREQVVEISSGLDTSDWLVVAGVHKLHDGQVVHAIDRDNRPVALR